MKTTLWRFAQFACAVFAAGVLAGEPPTPGAAAGSPAPLIRTHAHNDYEHPRPLLDALDNGFCSIEADIFLVDGQLLVGHRRSQLKPERALRNLYLDPLRERVKQNHGRVYPGGPGCWLFIDLKTDAEPTYAALDAVLKEYPEMLTRFEGERTQTNAITVVITGNRPRAVIAAQSPRWAAYDGGWNDTASALSPQLVPIVSEQWTAHFKWRGQGELPAADQEKLANILKEAHARHRLMRFWDAPDNAVAWKVLYDAGVDLINTDDLSGLRAFLLAR
jgi:hypothetical protein